LRDASRLRNIHQFAHYFRAKTLPSICIAYDDIVHVCDAFSHVVYNMNGRHSYDPLHLILGTSSEVGKTTAGVAVLRALRLQGHKTVVALKATGLALVGEIAQYQDFGASQAFDCIDFGLPTTFPQGRRGIDGFLGKVLDFCLSQPADALVVECAGDPVSANAPELLSCLKARGDLGSRMLS
jgi:hypothetical protein